MNSPFSEVAYNNARRHGAVENLIFVFQGYANDCPSFLTFGKLFEPFIIDTENIRSYTSIKIWTHPAGLDFQMSKRKREYGLLVGDPC
jgi:hypothetical protein